VRQLILPTTRLHASWLTARDEWGGHGVHQPGAALWRADGCDLDSPDGFTAWVTRLRGDADPSTPLPDALVHATTWWIVDDDTYLGSIQLRHDLNEHLLDSGGHIGYGIRPSARRRGHATWALGAVLDEARLLGLPRVLITCDEGNEPSQRTIERYGGVLEDVRDTHEGVKRRYWITW
jgi:predicted acetyltransferase